MEAKIKAEELFYKFNKEGLHQISSVINRTIRKEMIKQCAILCVKEVINTGLLSTSLIKHDVIADVHKDYWEEVIKEIENL